MEIDVIQFSSEIAEDIMIDKYGVNWDMEQDPILAGKFQQEYDHIYEMVFLGMIYNCPTKTIN